jgi:hypothetical protein
MANLFEGAEKGLPGMLGAIFTGQSDPRLNEQQNAAARKQAMVQAGLMTILSSGQNPGLLAPLAAGAMAGQQSRGQIAEQTVQRDAQSQMKDVLGQLMQGEVTPQKLQALMKVALQSGNMDLFKEAVSMYNKANEVQNVPAGGALYRGSTLLARNAAAPKLSPGMIDALSTMGVRDPANATQEQLSLAYQMDQQNSQARARAGATNLQVGFDKGRNEVDLTMYKGATDAATAASEMFDLGSQALQLLNADLPTGPVSKMTLPVRALMVNLGFRDDQTVSQQQVFTALSQKAAMLSRKAMLSGPTSDRDVKLLISSAANMSYSPEANKRLAEAMVRVAERQMKLPELMASYMDANGDLRGWHSFYANYQKSQVPLVPAQTQGQQEVADILNDPDMSQWEKQDLIKRRFSARKQ